VSTNWVANLKAVGRAYIAHFAMCATLEDRTHGKKRPCVRHPDCLYAYSVDTTPGYTVVGDYIGVVIPLSREFRICEDRCSDFRL
jgi:hypothetical protein